MSLSLKFRWYAPYKPDHSYNRLKFISILSVELCGHVCGPEESWHFLFNSILIYNLKKKLIASIYFRFSWIFYVKLKPHCGPYWTHMMNIRDRLNLKILYQSLHEDCVFMFILHKTFIFFFSLPFFIWPLDQIVSNCSS